MTSPTDKGPPAVDLRTIVDRLAAEATLLAGIPGGRANLPSRDAVIQIVEDLRSVFFPGYFGTSDVRAEALHFYLGATLERALNSLEEQVRRAFAFFARHDYHQCAHCAEASRHAVAEFLAGVGGKEKFYSVEAMGVEDIAFVVSFNLSLWIHLALYRHAELRSRHANDLAQRLLPGESLSVRPVRGHRIE